MSGSITGPLRTPPYGHAHRMVAPHTWPFAGPPRQCRDAIRPTVARHLPGSIGPAGVSVMRSGGDAARRATAHPRARTHRPGCAAPACRSGRR